MLGLLVERAPVGRQTGSNVRAPLPIAFRMASRRRDLHAQDSAMLGALTRTPRVSRETRGVAALV